MSRFPRSTPALLFAILLGVPFNPDKTDQCGPASLASLLTFAGRPTEPAELKRELYVEKLKGALAMDLLIAARARGFPARMPSGDLTALKSELDAGRPVLAFLNQGWRFLPIGHFLVLTGYDDKRGGFFAHSGAQKDAFVPYARFWKRWDRAGRWSMVVDGVPS